MAFSGVHVHCLILFGQWEAPAGDGGRRECDIRALPSWVSPGELLSQLCPLLLSLLWDPLSFWVLASHLLFMALGLGYKLWAPELFLVVSYTLLTPPSWTLLGIRPPQTVLNVPLLTAGILTNSLYSRTLQEGDVLVITLGTGKKWGFPGGVVVKKSTC